MEGFVRTIFLVLLLFVILAGVNMLGRLATPAVRGISPTAGAAFEFVF